MSSVPRPRFITVALSLLLVACGSVSETSGSDSEEIPSSPTAHSGSGQTAQCSPSIALGEAISAPLDSFTCPFGWDARARSNALPISGRFTNAREMVDALCTQSTDAMTTSKNEPLGIDIDFETNDVLAVPYNGEIGLHRRAGELWIRHTESCERTYRTALFVVPKDVEPREQTCTAPCQ